jgi:hypothetical protein
MPTAASGAWWPRGVLALPFGPPPTAGSLVPGPRHSVARQASCFDLSSLSVARILAEE